MGRREEGDELLRELIPAGKELGKYRAEPFVLAGDVSSAPEHPGRGGWSWYTGAAGWFLRTVVEELLGVRVENGEIRAEPVLPKDWPGYTLDYQVFGVNYRISVWREGENLRKEVKKL